MRNFHIPTRLAPLWVGLLLLGAGIAGLRAQDPNQPATPAPVEDHSTKPAGPGEFSQVELLKSYLRVREQLHAAELAIVNSRVETEATNRAQAAGIAEKLDAIKSAMTAERERQQAEALRANSEIERQQREAQQANRAVLWIAAAFGGTGLLAILFTALFQWRAMNRITEVLTPPSQWAAPTAPGLLAAEAGGPSGLAVGHSNQRMLAVIERMEQRIFELEHTAQPSAVATAESPKPADASRRPSALAENMARVDTLLTKGRLLLNHSKPREAAACYDEILALKPNHPEALLKKGVALERLQLDLEALRYYDRAIEVDRDMTLAYLYKGGVCNRQQRFEEALACYEQALRSEEAVKQVTVDGRS